MTDKIVPSKSSWRKPPRLYEEIARDLSESIADGSLAPGDFLPPEQDLASRYSASRSVTREALKILAAKGMIEAIHGRGSRVLPRYRWQMADQLISLLHEDSRVQNSLVEIRAILEVEIAGLAAERATADQIAVIRETIEQERASLPNLSQCIDYELRFHEELAQASGNVLMPQVLEPLMQLWSVTAFAMSFASGALESAVDAHARILDRVQARDAAGARQAMRDHIQGVGTNLSKVLRADNSELGLTENPAPKPLDGTDSQVEVRALYQMAW